MNMSSRLRIVLFVPLFLLCTLGARAQAIDYLKHRKQFDLCSFKQECYDCNFCGKQRILVKIKNNVDKKIKKISYVFYSDVYNKVITKEAKIKGDMIDGSELGLLYVCVQDKRHWAISEIVYTDDTKVNYVVNERLENFLQEPDECECND